MGNWVPIADIDLTDKIYEVMSCDTRDFHMICHEKSDTDFIETLIKQIPGDRFDEYSIRVCEIISWLNGIKEVIESHNHGTTKFFVLKFRVPDNVRHFQRWTKYIRFVHWKDGKYIIYTTLGDDKFPLSKMIVNKENIIY